MTGKRANDALYCTACRFVIIVEVERIRSRVYRITGEGVLHCGCGGGEFVAVPEPMATKILDHEREFEEALEATYRLGVERPAFGMPEPCSDSHRMMGWKWPSEGGTLPRQGNRRWKAR